MPILLVVVFILQNLPIVTNWVGFVEYTIELISIYFLIHHQQMKKNMKFLA
ncbi:hypothetical protein N9Y92_03110 [Chlamydiales bacterium]|nr:hypothetical protein [Chlamydiales bacterium]